tara:strand:+ start:472 stop:642 length:171 start_codon:yes stop_codon:yes gene_type:complete
MKFRILFRVAKFIAFYWSMPFFLGAIFSLLLITESQYMVVEALTESFEQVISSCAQ